MIIPRKTNNIFIVLILELYLTTKKTIKREKEKKQEKKRINALPCHNHFVILRNKEIDLNEEENRTIN
jgi:hypothetical protein